MYNDPIDGQSCEPAVNTAPSNSVEVTVQCTGEWLCSICSPKTTQLHSMGYSNKTTWGAPSWPLSALQEKVSPTTALWLDVYC